MVTGIFTYLPRTRIHLFLLLIPQLSAPAVYTPPKDVILKKQEFRSFWPVAITFIRATERMKQDITLDGYEMITYERYSVFLQRFTSSWRLLHFGSSRFSGRAEWNMTVVELRNICRSVGSFTSSFLITESHTEQLRLFYI